MASVKMVQISLLKYTLLVKKVGFELNQIKKKKNFLGWSKSFSVSLHIYQVDVLSHAYGRGNFYLITMNSKEKKFTYFK